MINRYQRPALKKLWSEKHRYEAFLKVELACLEAWHKLGLFDDTTCDKLNQASFDLKTIHDLEKETKHDVIAFTRAVSLSLGDEKKWFHYGLTSTDVVDTAQSLILRDVNGILKRDIKKLLHILKNLSYTYKSTYAIGRTHGIHAEITSFGLKFALWYSDLKRISEGLFLSMDNIEVAKLSGAVGNHSSNSVEFQSIASKLLNLKPANISTQTLQRDRHAFYISQIALVGSELEKIAVEIRHLSRTEVSEVSEKFSENQKGSSAMPHKKNPISSENISGLSRVLRGYMITSFENIALWHERDISHSSAERIILADATTLLDYMLNRMTKTLEGLVINEEQILHNIELTHGVIYAQEALNQLIKSGMNREDAYDLIQKLALVSLKDKVNFYDQLATHKEIQNRLSKEQLTQIFSKDKYLKYVSDIYDKVFQ